MAFGSEVKENGFIHRRVMAGFSRVDRRIARPRLDRSLADVYMFPVLSLSACFFCLESGIWEEEERSYAASSASSYAHDVVYREPGMTPSASSGVR